MNYTASELSKIIKACKEAKVKELRLGDLHVIFEIIEPKIEATIPQPPSSQEAKIKAEELARNFLEKQEFETKEERLARMALEDPAQFEDLMASGDLEDGGKEIQEH